MSFYIIDTDNNEVLGTGCSFEDAMDEVQSNFSDEDITSMIKDGNIEVAESLDQTIGYKSIFELEG